ncbi:MAG: magnesium transporter, partial [Bacilli bacterium]|nr:magnesium transporter [Bacilli bacterium]
YDLNALAVLNDDSCLVGVITIDDAVDVMTEESNEDLARMTNMEPTEKPYAELTAWENAKKCIPWIIALLILGTFTTMVLNRLESQTIFMNLPILVAFVPMLMDTGGNAGGQTTGLMIRGLALDEFGPKDILKVLFKEFRSALLVAVAVASFSFTWLLIEQYTGIVSDVKNFPGVNLWAGNCWTADFAIHSLRNAGLVGLTMFCAVVASKMVGTLLPMGAAAIKKDPALLSQPLLTTIMDVTTLMIYFALALAFFPHMA